MLKASGVGGWSTHEVYNDFRLERERWTETNVTVYGKKQRVLIMRLRLSFVFVVHTDSSTSLIFIFHLHFTGLCWTTLPLFMASNEAAKIDDNVLAQLKRRCFKVNIDNGVFDQWWLNSTLLIYFQQRSLLYMFRDV